MHRLVIALTTLLALVGVTVVGGYLLFFSASTDRAAAVVPADTPIYINLYLEPSTAQQMNLGGLLGRLPGFADQATLDTKVDEAVQQLLSGSGVDYRRDIKPWLGNQLAIGVTPAGTNPDDLKTLLVAAVKDRGQAEAGLARLSGDGAAPTPETYRGVTVLTGASESHAFLDDGRLLVLGSDRDGVHAAIDAGSGAAPALGSDAGFRAAMRQLPADHLASAYLNLGRLANAAGMTGQLDGFSSASLALVAEHDGLHVVGQAPFDQAAAGASARAGFAVASEPSSLSDWMPSDTQAEAVIFRLRQWLKDAEAQIGRQQGAEQVAQAIAQARAVIAFGLGLSVDDDLLPLLDREAALAITGLDEGGTPRGELLLRPSDADAAQVSLDRIRDALQQRGAVVSTTDSAGVTITTLDVPGTVSVAYTLSDGVIVIGLTPDDVAAAITAHASGEALGASAGYQKTFSVAGGRGGNELYVDVPKILSTLGVSAALPIDMRDILQHVTGVGVTVPAREDRIEFHAVATIE